MATRRFATVSSRGRLDQTLLAVEAWLDLADGETLIVEGDTR